MECIDLFLNTSGGKASLKDLLGLTLIILVIYLEKKTWLSFLDLYIDDIYISYNHLSFLWYIMFLLLSMPFCPSDQHSIHFLGITGTGGARKSPKWVTDTKSLQTSLLYSNLFKTKKKSQILG